MKLAAETLAKNGAKEIYALCTHGVLSGSAVEKIEASPLKELVVTNSLYFNDAIRKCKKIKTIDIAGILSEAIRRTHNGESISVLFNGDD
jgi:ribose-phosphate pyrophosphokinase